MREQRHRSVVITGMGLITPLGRELDETWNRLYNLETGVTPLESYPTGLGGGQVSFFNARKELDDRRLIKYINRSTSMALVAARQAWAHARLEVGLIPEERLGVYVGTGESEPDPEELFPALEVSLTNEGTIDYDKFGQEGLENLNPYLALTSLSNNALCYISIAYRAMGSNCNYVKSGVSSMQALGEAANAIREGYVDAAIVVGHDCLISPWVVMAYDNCGLLSRRYTSVEEAMRPFDISRDGFVPGEGAGVVILEEEASAKYRGATAYGRVLGYSQLTDAYHVVDVPESGGVLADVIQEALKESGRSSVDVDLIKAHGNATRQGDISESNAIISALGSSVNRIPVISTKPLTGHLGAASGVIESIFCLIMMRNKTIIPTLNLKCPDLACRLQLPKEHLNGVSLETVINISRGIGGQNAAIVLEVV